MSEKIGAIGIRLDQVDDTMSFDYNEMIRRIDSAIAEYGYKVRQHGPWSIMKRTAVAEAEFIDTIVRHTSDIPDNAPGTGWVTLGGKDESA